MDILSPGFLTLNTLSLSAQVVSCHNMRQNEQCLWCSEALKSYIFRPLSHVFYILGYFSPYHSMQTPLSECWFCGLVCIWSYLVDIASSLTECPCQLPWIETIATARSRLICRSVLSLLPGNARDKFSFVNWIALFAEGACWAVSVRTRDS